MQHKKRLAVAGLSTVGMLATALAVTPTGKAVATVGDTTLTYGTVTTEGGTPVAGARVALLADPVVMPTPGEVADVKVIDTELTDATGHYILSLPAGFTGAGLTDQTPERSTST